MKIVVLGSGTLLKESIILQIAKDAKYIICADGGVKHLFEYGLTPDIVVGDLDSISSKNLEIIKEKGIKIIEFPTNKDYTDLELALEQAALLGAKEVVIGGVIGTRLDHTMGNILILNKMNKENIKATIVDNNNEISLLDESEAVFDNTHKYISIIPVSNEGAVVSTEGFKYEVSNRKFEYSSLLGVSNEILGKRGKIKIHKGTCLIIKAND